MVALPEGISWVGATTDIGQVHAALQRRLTVYHLEPMSFEDRKLLTFTLLMHPMKFEALEEVAKRCWTPWEIKDEALVVIGDLTKATQTAMVDLGLTQQAFKILGIDQNGLRFREVAVLKALFSTPKLIGGIQRYAMSASALMASAGVDKKAFYGYIEPKLLQNGFIKITSAGRELTDKSLQEYFS
jgi:Holliday junction resolvasome RuvABC ATP-dependent DNA helicase subunit